jgi:hypothetical protein
MKQFCLTTSMGKRLIGKAMARHPELLGVLERGTLVIIAGTTNGYVAEEILKDLGQAEGFSREGFRRGMTVAPDAQAPKVDFRGDVVIRAGNWLQGLTIFDVADDLRAGDMILKGGNAFDPRGQAAVQIGHPQGGTILAAVATVVGRRVRLIVPIGLEKRVFQDVNVLAHQCNSPDARGPRLFPIPGEIFTELDAIKLLTGATATLIAAGGIYGAEGAAWLGVRGREEEVQATGALIQSLAGEPPCRV